MTKPVHRNTDDRSCGADTVVEGNSTVFANDLLVSVNNDPNSHGEGRLIAGANQVYAENKLVVRRDDNANPDNLCGDPGDHCSPEAINGSPNVFAGFPTEVNLGTNPVTGEPTSGFDRGPSPYNPQPADPDEPEAPEMTKASPGGSSISTVEEGGPFVGQDDLPTGSPALLFGDCTRPNLGTISERYESNGNPGAIGRDSTGGYSYGSYQIATTPGTFGRYMDYLQQTNITYYNELQSVGGESAATAGTSQFQNKWRELATDPGFEKSQRDFIQVTHYDPQVSKIKAETGIDICDSARCPGLQHAVWSTAVQHGPSTSIVVKAINAAAGSPPTDEDIINALYDEREKEVGGELFYFRNSTPSVQQSVKNRFVQERADALAAC